MRLVIINYLVSFFCARKPVPNSTIVELSLYKPTHIKIVDVDNNECEQWGDYKFHKRYHFHRFQEQILYFGEEKSPQTDLNRQL